MDNYDTMNIQDMNVNRCLHHEYPHSLACLIVSACSSYFIATFFRSWPRDDITTSLQPVQPPHVPSSISFLRYPIANEPNLLNRPNIIHPRLSRSVRFNFFLSEFTASTPVRDTTTDRAETATNVPIGRPVVTPTLTCHLPINTVLAVTLSVPYQHQLGQATRPVKQDE